MAAVPAWSAVRSGLLGDTGAVDKSAQIDQFLGAHPSTEIYAGAAVLTPNGTGGNGWSLHLDAYDVAQPFTMSGTTIGRVAVPLLPVGTGSDLIVELCANSAGAPGAVITRTRVPAAWIAQVAAVAAPAGPSGSLPAPQPTGRPLALSASNGLQIGPWTTVSPWTYPTIGTSALYPNSFAVSGSFAVFVGGNGSGGILVPNVYVYEYLGGTQISTATPMPSLPQALFSAAVMLTPDTIVCAGGTTAGGTTGTVYTAGWDPVAGQVSAWSQQASLPAAVASTTYGGSYGQTVYVAGGNNAGVLNTVYYTTVSNGQISAWSTGPPLPVALSFPNVTVVGAFLIVTGGNLLSGQVSAATYYAPINSDGSLGTWQPGPASPVPTSGGILAIAEGLTVVGGYTNPLVDPTGDIQSLGFGPNGPGLWQRQTSAVALPDPSTLLPAPLAFATGGGTYQVFVLSIGEYLTATLTPVPLVSVPLPATGLSNGTTYHVVLRQPGHTDPNDYLRTTDDVQVFPGNPTLLTRTVGSSTWLAYTAQHSVPMRIFDQTVSGQPWHTWEDSGARISTLVYATTPDVRLIGVLDAVAQPGPVLNQNWTFTAGTAPWAATGGAITQSSAHIQGGLPFSALLTPTGSAASSFIESEQVAVQQGHSYTATAWLYSPPGYSSVAVNINWYKSDHTALSTTSGTVTSLAAATWTQLSVTGAVPANAAYGAIVAIETGTPANAKLLYVSAATLQDASGPMLATVAQITYPGTWPGTTSPATGVVQLA